MKTIEETLKFVKEQRDQAYTDLQDMKASDAFDESDIRRQLGIWGALCDVCNFIEGEKENAGC